MTLDRLPVWFLSLYYSRVEGDNVSEGDFSQTRILAT
jgi:hypothetical protein